MNILKDKIALVTGVGRKEGIGVAICRELAKNGVDVFFSYWHEYDKKTYAEDKTEEMQDFADELKQYGVHVASAEVDLSQPESAKELFELVENELGSPNILINNACYDFEVPFVELTPGILDQHYFINVRAVTMLCKEFVKRGRAGNIINMTSGQSLGSMGEHKIPYTITKAALEMLTPQLAPELNKLGISITALHPGPTDTGWMDEKMKEQVLKDSKKGKINMPEDTAKLILELLLDNKTGQIIHAEW